MSEFLKNLKTKMKDEDTHILADGTQSAEFTGFIDTGSYALNALLSGSIYGGMADNKVLALAGPSSTGKSFFKIAIEKSFQKQFNDAVVVDYDTESATTKEMYSSRGIDPKRVIIVEPDSIQRFRSHVVKLLDTYLESPTDERPKMIIALDSLGNLSTEKEIGDITEGKDTRDMTRAQLVRGAFRVIRLKLAKAKIPMIVCNHVYDAIGSLFPTQEMSGGGGLKYSSDVICFLSKKKDKDGTEVIGNLITVKLIKSRLTKENSHIEVKLDYKKGLDRYHGLLPIALKYGIFTKLAKGIDIAGKRVYEKQLNESPETYYTTEVLEQIEEACKKEFLYGNYSSDTPVIKQEVETEVEQLDD